MRRALGLLLVLAAALLVAGCGGGGSLSFDPAASAANTSKAGTAKLVFATAIGAGAGKTLHMNGIGSVDFGAKEASMTFAVGDLLGASGLPAAANEQWTILTQGLIVYMHAPSLSRQLPGRKPWLKLDIQQLAKSRNANLGQFRELTQNDPTQMLAYLKATSGKVKKVGTEDVRGTSTTHYTATVDLAKVAEQAPANVRKAFRTSIIALEDSLGTDKLPVDVWVDKDNLVRRLAEHLDVAGAGRIDFSVDFYDFGTPVTITTPPASETLDLGQVLGG